jgi:heterodisulfide reductase subunit D
MKEDAVKSMEENINNIKASGAKYLVTTCPSCYHTWKEIYPKIVKGMPEIELLHGTQLIAKLVKEGAFQFKNISGAVTYHDPCDLGRKSGVYDDPREVLKSIPGVTLKEMKFNRKEAYCCGGGGNLEMNDPELRSKVSQLRVEQALKTGAEMIVTSCQQCKRTLTEGARQKRARIKVMELGEFVKSAIE